MKATKAKRADPLVAAEQALAEIDRVREDLRTALELLRRDRQRADVQSDELIGPKAAAEVLGCNARTLRRWKREGRLPPPIVLGRTPKWRRGEIEELVRREGAA